MVNDINIRDTYNLLFPLYSDEADKVEKDSHKQQKTERSETNDVIEEDSEVEDANSLECLPYFHGEIKREVAEMMLKKKHIGTFLVR